MMALRDPQLFTFALWFYLLTFSFCLPGAATEISLSTSGKTPGEQRFFADCPHPRHRRLHDEGSPWDIHALLFSGMAIAELEVLRLADWCVDLPFPGAPVRPFQRSVHALRDGYHRLPRWLVVERIGELVDALQIPELSFGDATATYSVATSGARGPGSGMVIRVQKLVDWVQHVVGDLNRGAGRAVRRPGGLVAWSLPDRMVDRAQWLLLKTFNQVGVLASRGTEGVLTGIERTGEILLGVGAVTPHEERAVFLRVPPALYRTHELWFLGHPPDLLMGTAEEFRRSTHAALAHGRRATPLDAWGAAERLLGQEDELIVLTNQRFMVRAPAWLKPYVVPAAWVLNEEPGP
jgi:hypothetical protein